VCVREDNLTHYTINNLHSLYNSLNFPKPHKGKIDKTHACVTVPAYGDIDEVDTEMVIPHKMGTFSHIDFRVTCSDSNCTDWKHDWETIEDQAEWPKFRVYIYGVNDFLPNFIHFNITATVRLNKDEMPQM